MRISVEWRRLRKRPPNPCTYLEVEHEATALVETLIRADNQLEVEQIVRVRELGGTCFRQV